MESSVKFCWVLTCWMLLGLLCLFFTSAAHSEDIHDVRNHGGSDEVSKWSSPSDKQVNPDVYEELWQENLDLAQKTLKLPFLQHMQLGDLPPESYVTFTIQDIYYLAEVTDMLGWVVDNKEMPEELKWFLVERFESYDRFSKKMLQDFTLNSVNDIKVTTSIENYIKYYEEGVKDVRVIPAMQTYLDEYKRVMAEEEPIMFAVSLLPCSRLWVWLANQLSMDSGNAYWTWKKSNKDGKPEKFRNVLNKYLKEDKDVQLAKKIFRDQMQNEFNFFKASLPN